MINTKTILLLKKELELARKWIKKNGGGYKEYLEKTRLKVDKS